MCVIKSKLRFELRMVFKSLIAICAELLTLLEVVVDHRDAGSDVLDVSARDHVLLLDHHELVPPLVLQQLVVPPPAAPVQRHGRRRPVTEHPHGVPLAVAHLHTRTHTSCKIGF